MQLKHGTLPSLTEEQKQRIERVQKQALKVMLGECDYNAQYDELLARVGIDKLEDRREKAMEKFAKQCSKNTVFYNM